MSERTPSRRQTPMNSLDRQTNYWGRVAEEKEFTHPLDVDGLRGLLPAPAVILDLGCGYGRTCSELAAAGFSTVIGLDIAPAMIERGRGLHPAADLRVWSSTELPFPARSIDAVLLVALLTCIPSTEGQRALIADVHRVLRPDGVLYVSDYPIQEDARNQRRYARFASRYGTFGVFELPEGVVLRHHTLEWIDDLLAAFRQTAFRIIEVPTMNANPSKVFQYFGRKRAAERAAPPAGGRASPRD